MRWSDPLTQLGPATGPVVLVGVALEDRVDLVARRALADDSRENVLVARR